MRAPPISSSVVLLPDHHLGHARRAEVHRGVALDHEHDVAERRDVRAARGRRAEQAAHLRHLARQPHLVVEDAPRAAPAREQLDLVGDARARPSRRARTPAARARSAYSVSRTIFSTVRAPHEPAFTVGSFAITHTGRPSTVPTPVTTPSAGRSPASALASSASSTNEPSSSSSASRSRTNSLPWRASFSRLLLEVPLAGPLGGGAELVGHRPTLPHRPRVVPTSGRSSWSSWTAVPSRRLVLREGVGRD